MGNFQDPVREIQFSAEWTNPVAKKGKIVHYRDNQTLKGDTEVIPRIDYIFTIGFQGNAAIVDGALKRKYGSHTALQLAEKGLYKQALCSALHDDNENLIREIMEIYNKEAPKKIRNPEDFKKTLGVTRIPEGIARVIVV
jgi:hypothetical protein